MGGSEGGLKWIARPGLVRGLDRMAALGVCEGGPVEPHTGLGEPRLGVIPQAVNYGLLPTSLERPRCGRAICRGHVPAVK